MVVTAIPDTRKKMRVAIVGGGLAGMAAATALQSCGCGVALFETRRGLGGRAGSFRDLQTGNIIDRCRHVAMGCCVNLADFCRRNGIGDSFTRYKTLHFFGPDARRYDFSASRWLPAPLHLGPAVMRLGFLCVGERLGILSALGRLLKTPIAARPANIDRFHRPDEPVEQWLRRQGQSDRAIERFWSIILESALSEKLNRASLAAARKVFFDGFMTTRDAYELLVPRFPLAELFDRRAGDNLRRKGVAIHRRARIAQIDGDASGAASLTLSDGTRREFDAFVVAVPWHKVKKLFSPSLAVALPWLGGLDEIPAAPITALHLWHDRPITELPHAVFVCRLGQWLFNHGDGYSQIVVSASGDLISRGREDVCREILAELEEVLPAARDARLVHWRLVSEPRAVFSLRPGVDGLRPEQRTSIHNLALAGDWTNTHWPATMEGAVRSGYLAAEAVLEFPPNGKFASGRDAKAARFLVDEPPMSALCRWIAGRRKDAKEKE